MNIDLPMTHIFFKMAFRNVHVGLFLFIEWYNYTVLVDVRVLFGSQKPQIVNGGAHVHTLDT